MSAPSSLRGSLRDFGIAEVFQLIGQQRKTGVLALSRRREAVEILFDRGAVVSAGPTRHHPDAALAEMLVRCGVLTRDRSEALLLECEKSAESLAGCALAADAAAPEEIDAIRELLTRETIFEVLRWTKGSFEFTAGPALHDRDATELLGAEQILMDGMRMLDESAGFAEAVPSEEVVFQRVADAPAPPGAGEAAARVLALVDGRLPVRRVVDLSRLGRFEATRSLARLREAGVIEPVEHSRRRRRVRSLRAAGGGALRRALASGLCLALLYACALGARRASQRPAPPGIAIASAPLERLRLAWDGRRVRYALETFHLLEGRWPAGLGELVARGLLPRDALASPRGRSYHYEAREEGPLLLAVHD